jgi:hypothetical protein
VLEEFLPNSGLTFGGLMPLGLIAAPAVMMLFRRHPLVWLAVPSTGLYLAIMSVPLLAFGYIYLTYYEILYSPVRNVAPFAYLFTGALVYAAVIWLAGRDRTRISLPLAGAVAGSVGVLASVCLNQSPRGFFLPLIVACAAGVLAAGDGLAGAGRGRRVLAAVLVAGGAVALWPERAPVPPATGVGVEWAAGLPEEDRGILERRFQLIQGEREPGARENWRYLLTDLSRGNVRALVEHPQVAETEGIDRDRFSVARQPPDDVDDLFLGTRLVAALMYPGPWMFIGTAAAAWGITFLVPFWLATARGQRAASAIEEAIGTPFLAHAVPYALFMIPFVVLTARPAYSPLLVGAPVGGGTPSGALANLPCLNLGPRPVPFAEDVAAGALELPPLRACMPSAAVVTWIRSHVPADSVFVLNRWSPVFVPLVLPQQIVALPGTDGTLAEERTLFARYYEFYDERLRSRGVQPFFNAVETPAERAAFVEALGVTHVLVDPPSLGEMRPVLDGLPDLFTRLFVGDGWAVYEVQRAAARRSAGGV